MLIVSLGVTLVFADNSYQEQMRTKYKKMSTNEALNSRDFKKEVTDIYIPGAETPVKGTDLCIKDDKIESLSPLRGICVQWAYRNSNGVKISTVNVTEALKNDGQCLERSSKYISVPISYKAGITVWGAENANGVVRTFMDYDKAAQHGRPFFVTSRLDNKRKVPTNFEVDFFINNIDRNNEYNFYLGRRRLHVPKCR